MTAPAHGRLPATLLLLMASGTASASNYDGFVAFVTQWAIVIPWTLAALIVTVARFRDYADLGTALGHSAIAAIGPILGFAAVAVDRINQADKMWLYGFDGFALLLTIAPLLIHWLRQPGDPTPKE